MLVAFNKPYGVLTQFTDTATPPRPTLAGYGLPRPVRPAGPLDFDSEGLLLLSDQPQQIHRLTHPRFHQWKTYLAQVEGVAGEDALERLRQGVQLRDGATRPAQARHIGEAPAWLWPRDPPIRFRKTVPDTFIELRISEGRNRQVRRMTAAVGLPTLRLVRVAIGDITLGDLAPGQWRIVS